MKKLRKGKNKAVNKADTETKKTSIKQSDSKKKKQPLKQEELPEGVVKVEITKTFGKFSRWEVVLMDEKLAEYHKSRVKEISGRSNKAILDNKNTKWL